MEIGKVTRVKRFSAIVDDKSADNSDYNLIFISVGLTCLKASPCQKELNWIKIRVNSVCSNRVLITITILVLVFTIASL